MLYGPENIQKEILSVVRQTEKERNIKVLFGSVVGSVSKGIERPDSDYDTRFLYLEKDNSGKFIDYSEKDDICEKDVHFSVLPIRKDIYYDKIAFWEITSFVNYLNKPVLDKKYSCGLYHLVPWTFFSPYRWDPYNFEGKIRKTLEDSFLENEEITYYVSYISKMLNKPDILMREYLYAAYYSLAIEYCRAEKKFPPFYFPELLAWCSDDELKEDIKNLTNEFYIRSYDYIIDNIKNFRRKMCNNIPLKKRYIYVDDLIRKVQSYNKEERKVQDNKKQVKYIIDCIMDSANSADSYIMRFEEDKMLYDEKIQKEILREAEIYY